MKTKIVAKIPTAIVFAMLTMVGHSFAAPDNVRISSMADYAYGTWPGSGDFQSSDPVCIYQRGGGVKSYQITMTGSGTAGAFTISNGTSALAYTPEFAGTNGVFDVMTTGVARTFLQSDKDNGTICSGVPNAQMRITITGANMATAEAGNYSGVLTVLLSP